MEQSSTSSEAPPRPRSDLTNLVRYAERVQNWTDGKSFPDYQQDTLLNDAVERNLIEIGNIIHRLETTAPELYQQIPQAREWYAFRIKLVHARWKLLPTIVWQTIQEDLPPLLKAAQAMLINR